MVTQEPAVETTELHGEHLAAAGLDALEQLSAQSDLSRSQLLMWLGQKLAPEAPLYNMIQTFSIEGEIQVEAFRRAFAALVSASDALRTTIQEVEGIPCLRLLAEIPDPVEVLDFSGRPDPQAAYTDWLEERRARRFRLDEKLFDCVLIRLEAQHFVWYLSQHHLITDGWSFGVVYRRTAELYGLARTGELDAPPGLPAHAAYRAYEAAQQNTPAQRQAEAYWQDKLSAPAEPLAFYGSAPRQKSHRTERVVCDLGPERSERLRALAAAPGFQSLNRDLSLLNLFTTLFSAFLRRVAGARQVTIGMPFHNRPTPTFKETIGLFIEMFPLRVEVSEGETFRSVHRKAAAEALTVLRHARPGASRAEHNRSYEAVLNFVNVTFPAFDGLPTRVDWIHPGYGDRDHRLRLQIHDFNASGSYELHFDFNCEAFAAPRREAAVRHFLKVVDACLDDPDLPVDGFSLQSPEEERAFLVEYNRSAAPYPAGQTVVDLFEAQVARTPDDEAVRFGETALTYRELDERANQLARRLRALGVGPEQLVPICMEHSLAAVTGLLGILKAGGAYVPLDPAYPPGRLAFMLADIHAASGQAPVLLAQPWLAGRLPPGSHRQLLLDDSWAALDGESRDRLPDRPAGPQNLAYVIYTSGSTGKPKGAMIEHRGLVNYLWWAKGAYLGGERLTFPLFSSLSFDLTVTSIYLPLISGGRIVVYQEDPGVRGMVILKVIDDDQADLIKLTPAHLALIKDQHLGAKLVRKFIVGGEDFKTALAQAVYTAKGGQVEIYNEYGPTETVVGCMIHRYDPQADGALLSVPIGVPAANARIYVLDPHLNPVPAGMVGEMYIGGDGVGRGYLNRPELTRERFIPVPITLGDRVEITGPGSPNPLSPIPFLYRTGDLATWGDDGRLVFLGRADDQVKVGGVRIELGEIETRLREHPEISAEVVDVHQPRPPDAPTYCVRCGLASAYPGVTFDEAGLCSLCRAFEAYKDEAQAYFRTPDELRNLLERASQARGGAYDCLALFSGGKDSTFMLAQLAGMGLKVLAFTLDNGYLSETAISNIRRVAAALGVDHVFGSTPAMKAIFADSLRQFSNVCNGCFKTIYTLAVNLAREKGIPCIVTGLSRGQFFETRLTEDLFRQKAFDPEAIDRAILEARKAYHRRDDLVSRSLDVDIFRDESVFEDIQFIDFYRYWDVSMEELYAFLEARLPWVRPEDTGRSTNCLINDVGIFVHKQQRGYHNYALPYSWDVRLGHKQRESALEELDDRIDEGRVRRILAEIGFDEPLEAPAQAGSGQLVAYYVAGRELPAGELRRYLAETLPDFMLPAYFVRLEVVPLTQNGKVDRRALPGPVSTRTPEESASRAPASPVEARLAEIWQAALGVRVPGVDDNFFALGGSSLPALQVIARASAAFGIELPVQTFFENPTIAQLARAVEDLLLDEIEALSEEEVAELTASSADRAG